MAAFGADPVTGRIRSETRTDPAPFLNGTSDLTVLQRNRGRVDAIRCD